MADERSLFERLDNIEAQNEKILQALSKEEKQPQANTPQQAKPSNRQILETFLKQARKSWMWLGTRKEFKRAKILAILSSIILIIATIVSSIVTSIAFHFYSTFTFFENIWLIFAIFTLVYKVKAERIYEINNMIAHSTRKSELDKVGMAFFKKEKVKYKVFRILAIISTVANIVFVWAKDSHFSVSTTIVEVLLLGAIIFEYIMHTNLFMMYSVAYIEGRNLTTHERVVLVLPPGAKMLMPEEEFKEKMSFLYD